MAEQVYGQTYHSFGGTDIQCVFGDRIIGEVQGISYTITREKAPIYTMGSADPRSFSRGKRGIAGSVIFTVFDRSALLEEMNLQNRRYLANKYELFSHQRYSETVRIGTQKQIGGLVGANVGVGVEPQLAVATNAINNDKVLASPAYLDQIPPFNIVLTMANEYGHSSSMAIYGVEILNNGSGLSVDDISTDEACTFVATAIRPWNGQMHIDLQRGIGAAPRHNPGLSGARSS